MDTRSGGNQVNTPIHIYHLSRLYSLLFSFTDIGAICGNADAIFKQSLFQCNKIYLHTINHNILIDKKVITPREENALLVGIIQKDQTEQQVMEYMDELEFLAETAGVKTVKRFTQKMARPDSKTFLGKGKLEEIKDYIQLKGNISMVIFDDELTGSQIINIEKAIEVKTIDRSDLSLIFLQVAQRVRKPKHRLNLRNINIFFQG